MEHEVSLLYIVHVSDARFHDIVAFVAVYVPVIVFEKIAYSVIGSVTVGLAIGVVAQLIVFHHTKSQPSLYHVYSERFKSFQLVTCIDHDVVEVHQLVL